MDEKRMKSKVEEAGISAVSSAYFDVDGVVSHLNKDDKLVSWDGQIYVYKDESESADKLTGRINVQVKTLSVTDEAFNKLKTMISYAAKHRDLVNYLNEGGCVYYVVYLNRSHPEQKKIYLALLTVTSLRSYLKDKDTAVIDIHLRIMPDDRQSKREQLTGFLLERELQTSYAHKKLLGADDIFKGKADASLIVSNFTNLNVMDSPFQEELNWYMKTSDDLIPLESRLSLGTGYDVVEDVCLEDARIADRYQILFMGETVKIIIGNLIVIKLPRTCITDSNGIFKIDTTIKDSAGYTISLIKEASVRTLSRYLGCFIKILEGEKLNIASADIAYNKKKTSKKALKEIITVLDSQWKNSRMIVQLWDDINYQGDLTFSEMSREDMDSLSLLLNGILHHRSVDLPVENADAGFYPVAVKNVNYLIGFVKAGDHKYEIMNPFTKEFQNDVRIWPGNNKNYSIFAYLSSELMRTCINIDWSLLVPSFEKLPASADVCLEAFDCLNRIETAYLEDASKSEVLLTAVKELSYWIFRNTPESILNGTRKTISSLEISSLERALSDDEKEILYGMCESADTSDWYKLLAYSVLKNKECIVRFFKKADEQHKKAYLSMPVSYPYRTMVDPADDQDA